MDIVCIAPLIATVILFGLFVYGLTHLNVSRTGATRTLPSGDSFTLEQWLLGAGAARVQPPRIEMPPYGDYRELGEGR